MSNSDSPKKSSGTLQAVIAAVVIALVAGGTSPWWWNVLFPKAPTTDSNAHGSNQSTSGGVIEVKLVRDPFYLASNPSFVLQKSNIHGDLQLGGVYWQHEVWIENLRYEHAVGMAAPDNGIGYADFKVPPGAKYFQTIFGFARDDKNPNGFGNAIGRIYLDDDRVWESAVSGAQAMHTGAIPVPSGTKRLRLEVDSQGTNWGDQTTWGDPYFSGAK
jgi:hypothetical protein